MSAELSRLNLYKVVSDGQTDPGLLHMVRRHYDNETLMRLQGEIHFDAALSRAEVEVAGRVYGQPMPQLAYLPCGGTLRHALPLLERGVEHLVAVDLSFASLTGGLMRNVPEALRDRLSVYHGDVRFVGDSCRATVCSSPSWAGTAWGTSPTSRGTQSSSSRWRQPLLPAVCWSSTM